jgi:hypothetical protein
MKGGHRPQANVGGNQIELGIDDGLQIIPGVTRLMCSRCRIRPKSHGLPIAQLGATAPWPCLIGFGRGQVFERRVVEREYIERR